MGGRDFHDLDPDPDDERPSTNSNEKAFVRDLLAAPDDADARRGDASRARHVRPGRGDQAVARHPADGPCSPAPHDARPRVGPDRPSTRPRQLVRASGERRVQHRPGSGGSTTLWRDDFRAVSRGTRPGCACPPATSTSSSPTSARRSTDPGGSPPSSSSTASKEATTPSPTRLPAPRRLEDPRRRRPSSAAASPSRA